MNDLALDWLWLYLQIIILVVITARELMRPRKRNIFAIVMSLTMLILVQGQAWWILDQFEGSDIGYIQHLRQTINLGAARLANMYVGLSVICFGTTYVLFTLYTRPVVRREADKLQYRTHPPTYNLLAAAWVLVTSTMLLQISGGLEAIVFKPGQTMAGGVTMFLMMVGLGKFPLFHKVAYSQKINWADLALCSLVLFLFLLNARFLAIFVLLQLVVLVNYCRVEIPRRGLLGIAFLVFLILIVFGLYREFTTRFESVELEALQEFFVPYILENGALDWFYHANVEGFVGLAGILTFEASQGGIAHDFGLSNLSVLTKLIPYVIRNDPDLPFMAFAETVESMYPYQEGTLIPSGMEMAYAHFGLPGVLGFGAVLGYLPHWLHTRMSNPRADRVLIALLSVVLLHLIRGLFGGTFLLGLVEIIALLVYRFMRSMEDLVRFQRSSI